MDYTSQRKKELKAWGINIKQMAYATLVVNGWNKSDAYMVSFNESITVSKEWVASQVDELDKNESVSAYIIERRNEKKTERNEDKELLQSLSKEETLKELARARNMCAVGSKEWLDINKQIIEVNQLKKEEIKTEDTTVHFYLPLPEDELQSLIVLKAKELIKKGEV